MTDAPAPLVDAGTDISGLDGFMLDVERLMASELWALASGDEFKAAIGLWCRAWKQSPPGSLPNDEKVLAAFSGAGPKWGKVREVALRGFVLCSDGRLYHRVLCEDVKRAALKKAERRERTKAATEARNKQRNVDRNGGGNGAPPGNVTTSHRQGQGQGRDEVRELPHDLKPEENGFSGFEDSCGSQNADAPPFTEAEVEALRLEFPAVDVLADLPTLVAWAAQKGITDRGDLRQALGGALRGRQLKADLVQRFNGSAAPAISTELASLVRRMPQ